MIETHAYDGWATPSAKASFAYYVTRVLSNIPAALFLTLAGVGAAFALAAAERRGTAASVVRRQLARRALGIVGYGYLVNVIYALIEGRAALTAPTLLRADILHCIGLSLALCAVVVLGRPRPVLRAVAVAAVATGCALLTHGPLARGGAASPFLAPLALLVDVPGYTRFPLFPLCAFTAFGMVLGRPLARAEVPVRRALALSVLGVAAAVCFTWATQATVTWLGGTLSRGHPAVVWNLLNGAARAAAVIFVCLAIGTLRARAAAGGGDRDAPSPLVRLGRGSLLAYAFHIPFCYGRLAETLTLSRRLSMATASYAVVALVLLTYLAVRVRDLLRARSGKARPART